MDDLLSRPLSSRASKRSSPEDVSTSVGADLSVSGVHALFFDDDAVASFINSRNALVPWNGDESLLIDRYDVRHLLLDLSTVRKRRAPSSFLDVTEEELNYERYRDLDGLGEDDPSSDDVSKTAIREYGLVPFSYAEGVSQNGMNAESRTEGSSFEPPFIVPDFLLSKLPSSQKIHQIMAGTAKFVSKHGGQSEIILRVKQGKNPAFGFLNPDHHLHEYFRFLVDNPELVGGTARKRPRFAQVSGDSCEGLSLLGSIYGTDDDDDDDNHDDIFKSQIERGEFLNDDDVSICAHHQADECTVLEVDSPSLKLTAGAVVSDDGLFGSDCCGVEQTSFGLENEVASAGPEKAVGDKESFQIFNTLNTHNNVVLEPPLPLKRVIEKMVEFIMRNGKEFETVVRDRDKTDGRFQFLLPWNEYHSFYLKALEAAQEETMKKGKKVILNLRSEKPSSQDTSRANYLGPLLQDKTKGNVNLITTQPSEAKVTSKNLPHSERKMKILVGKKEFIPPNKNNIGQLINIKVDRSVGLNSESAAAGVNGVTHRSPVGPKEKGIVVVKDQIVLPSDKDEDYGMTADAAAAVVMAATRRLREVKQDTSSSRKEVKQDTSNNRPSSSGQGQKQLSTVREASAVGCTEGGVSASGGVVGSGMDDVGIAKAAAQAAAFAIAHEADSADASLTPAEKLKAERLRKAKMFATMIRSGQNVTEGITVPLGQKIGARTAGSQAVGSGSNIPTGKITAEVQKICDFSEYNDSKGLLKSSNQDLESVTEGGSLIVLQSASSNSKHHSDTREDRENQLHEYHLKKRKSHHNKDEDRDNYSHKRSHLHDSSDSKLPKKSSDCDVGNRSRHKSKRLYAEESMGSKNEGSHRRMSLRNEAIEDDDKHRKKKSHHDHKGDQDGKHKHSKHKQGDDYLSDSADEKQRSRKHRHRSVSPSEVRKSCGTKNSGHKEPQESLRQAIDQLESSEYKKTADIAVDVKKVILGGESDYLTAEEVPDDIRAKVRALLLLNS